MTVFTVIDKTTGEYPDCEKIALNEDWAKGLCYCDIDQFAIEEDGCLLLMDDCGKVAYCPPDRFEVVHDSLWHTELPTEEGWYVCKLKGADLYETEYFTGVNWNKEIIEKWQKIEETD